MPKHTVEEKLEYLQGQVEELLERDKKRENDIKKLKLDLRSAEDSLDELEDAVFGEEEDEDDEAEEPEDDEEEDEDVDDLDDEEEEEEAAQA